MTASGSVALRGIVKRHGSVTALHAIDLDIRPGLYDTWLDCLIQAVRKHDVQFSSEVEEAWRTTLRPGIEYMRAKY